MFLTEFGGRFFYFVYLFIYLFIYLFVFIYFGGLFSQGLFFLGQGENTPRKTLQNLIQ